jgi:putative mRNA 3-end processing factor
VSAPLLEPAPEGLGCARGGFHVDPWGAAATAVVTHVHGDHLVPGSARYVCAAPSLPFLRKRLGPEVAAEGVPYGESFRLGDVTVSFHPSGHVRGAAQVRLEAGGEVWVVSGDYKRAPDPTCAPFELVPCDVFITEATFALPLYRWRDPQAVVREILAWWDGNRAAGVASVLFAYAMGKAPRILAELTPLTDPARTVLVHGAVEGLVELYREAGVRMLPTSRVSETARGRSFAGELILAPPAASGTTWMRRFGAHETALASGWMRVRGTRRRKGFDRGFALSDHADWPALLRTIEETGARRVLVTHGYADELSRYLREHGYDSAALPTPFQGEADLES